MTILDTKQSNPHHGVGAYNETIRKMQAFELPRAIDKQLVQLFVVCDLPQTIYEGLTSTEQLTLSCLLNKVNESRKVFPSSPMTIPAITARLISETKKLTD